MKRTIVLALIMLMMMSCTDNWSARNFGGDMEISIPAGNKVTNITWKGDELWYSYRPFTDGEEPTTTTFHEESSFGVWEGTVTFTETK